MRRSLVWIFLAAIALSAFASAETRETIDLRGRSQTLHMYGRPGDPAVLLSSGDLGWAGLVTHVAEFLSSRGYYVVGFNSKAYLSSFTTRESTLRPADVPGDYHTLVDYARRGTAARPVLAGISEGAGLSVLAATNPSLKPKVQGVMGLGLPDQNELGWKWQDFTIWITKKVPNEPSFMVEDIIGKVTPVPLAQIQSTHDEFVPLDLAKSMFARAGEPKKLWVIDAANHRFSDNRDELDRRILEALDWIRSR